MRVGAQRRPFQRQSLGLVIGGLGQRRQARDVAFVVQDRGCEMRGVGGEDWSGAGATAGVDGAFAENGLTAGDPPGRSA